MVILSLDLSLNRSGYCVLDTSKRVRKDRILDVGVISNKHLPTNKIGLKLFHIENALKALLYAYNPDVIVVEELTGTAWTDTTRLSMVHGILEKLTMKFENVVHVNNMTFKKDFTGTGKAKKEDVEVKVLEYLPNLKFRYSDESDACGIAIYYTIKENLCTW